MAKKQSAMLKIAQAIASETIANQTKARLQMGFDGAIIAAHKVFKMGPGRSAAFRDAYNEAMDWLADLYVTDADENKDEKLTYAKTKRDALICSIVGEENFVPFDISYGRAYMDEAKRIRVKDSAKETIDGVQ